MQLRSYQKPKVNKKKILEDCTTKSQTAPMATRAGAEGARQNQMEAKSGAQEEQNAPKWLISQIGKDKYTK